MPKSSFWTGWFVKPRERFSLEELEHLCGCLERTPEVNSTNREATVETLRSIAELMIWGDQHEPKFFEFFLEKNILGHFHRILMNKGNRTGDIAKQVLQTLSIMIQNLRSETSVFYLFSNNHINDIVQLGFDFEDEEVLGYYISFLKTISLKLNASTVQFFFQDNGEISAFPLYTEAIRFINHKEGMVRTAVRTLTLNVYSVSEMVVQDFVVTKPANNYFSELALLAAEHCQALDRILSNTESGTSSSGSLDSHLAEIEDMIAYFNDIFLTGSEQLAKELSKSLWEYLIGPVVLWPLLDIPNSLTPKNIPFCHEAAKAVYDNDQLDGTDCEVQSTGSVRPVSALYTLERLLYLMEHPLLINAVVSGLLAGSQSSTVACERCSQNGLKPQIPDAWPVEERYGRGSWGNANGDVKDRVNSQNDASTSGEDVIPTVSPFAAASTKQGVPEANGNTLPEVPSTQRLYLLYRDAFNLCFTGGNCQLGAAAVRVLVALIDNQSVDPDILDIAGVLPYRRRVRRGLLLRLAGSQDFEDDALNLPSGRSGRMSSGKRSSMGSDDFLNLRLPGLPEQKPKEFKDKLTEEHLRHLSVSSMDSFSNGNMSPQASLTSDLSMRFSASPRTKNLVDDLMDAVVGQAMLPEPGDLGNSFVDDENAAAVEITTALCQLLFLPMLPPTAIWHTAWLLNQLMPSSNEGVADRATKQQLDVLNIVSASARKGVLDELRGMWCDALLPLVHMEWAKARQGMMKPSLPSNSRAILSWIHAQQSHQLGMELARYDSMGSDQVNRKKGLSLSARTAVFVHHKVRRMVAMLQLRELLNMGTIPEACGLPSVTEVDLASSEVREACEVQLSDLGSLRCTVAFSKGQERNVHFSVYGLPQSSPESAEDTKVATIPISMESVDLASCDVSKLVPVVILAAPSLTSLHAGMVLSVAPLLGTDPVVDSTHPRWLHLHVRPSIRRFVKAAQASENGARSLLQSWQSLVDGHWVLSFGNYEDSNNAKLMVQQHAAKIAALYCDILTPLLAPDV